MARALDELTGTDYRAALTVALPAADHRPFLDCGFEVHERLHLLVRSLDRLPSLEPCFADLQRARHRHLPAVLAIDAAAFPPFWQLDGPGLDDAMGATPTARLRVAAGPGGPLVGYAITGRAGPRGYLQRLAVAPPAQRRGVGAALVVDGLRWLRRWGAKEVLVNTQRATSLRSTSTSGSASAASRTAWRCCGDPSATPVDAPGGRRGGSPRSSA